MPRRGRVIRLPLWLRDLFSASSLGAVSVRPLSPPSRDPRKRVRTSRRNFRPSPIGSTRRAKRRDHGRDRAYNLDTLFEALKIAPDNESARAIEQRIWAMWIASGSDTCNLLMGRVKAATEQKGSRSRHQASRCGDRAQPDYTEAWNRRATIYYLQKDFGHALSDIREVLAREPRHFGALSGLGLILQEIGDEKHALEAYRRALAIDPHLENVEEAIKNLREKVEGREI